MNIKVENKLIGSKGNESPFEFQIDILSPALQKFIDMLLEDIIIEHMEELQSTDRSAESKSKPAKQTKGSVIDPTQKKKPLKIKGFCKASTTIQWLNTDAKPILKKINIKII